MWVTDDSIHSLIANCMKEMKFCFSLPDSETKRFRSLRNDCDGIDEASGKWKTILAPTHAAKSACQLQRCSCVSDTDCFSSLLPSHILRKTRFFTDLIQRWSSSIFYHCFYSSTFPAGAFPSLSLIPTLQIENNGDSLFSTGASIMAAQQWMSSDCNDKRARALRFSLLIDFAYCGCIEFKGLGNDFVMKTWKLSIEVSSSEK